MTFETRSFDVTNYLTTTDDVIAYLEAGFEDGDPAVVAAAIDDVARALGRPNFDRHTGSDLASVARRLRSLGFELTAKAA